MYSFDDFRDDVKWRVRELNHRLDDPEAPWPGTLILDTPEGLSAAAFEIGDSAERQHLAEVTLPREIRRQRARRFCWVMPAERQTANGREECLLLVIGERGRIAAALARVIRSVDAPPRLGPLVDGPFGAGSRRVSGRFVDPLLAALR
jgi:hypothetical protein